MNSPLKSTDWLLDHLADKDVKVIDTSWHMPASGRSAAEEYKVSHISQANFLNIDTLSDESSPLPHMIPAQLDFELFCTACGINQDDTVIIYDNSELRTAARGWLMFKYFGHANTFVLDGGLQKWIAEDKPVTDKETSLTKGNFKTKKALLKIKSLEDVMTNLSHPNEQVIDARAVGRYSGDTPEPRAGLKSGHIPNSLNLPFNRVIDENGCYNDDDQIRKIYTSAGVDYNRPIITSCGSGVTACVLALAFYKIGKNDVAIYDGSWSEWGQHPTTPVEIGLS